jgi:hypothetical protein
MTDVSNIHKHMEVVGSCGAHVGTVDRVEGSTIKLTRDDANADGRHHWIPVDWVASVDEVVRLNQTCGQAMRQWQAEAPTS